MEKNSPAGKKKISFGKLFIALLIIGLVVYLYIDDVKATKKEVEKITNSIMTLQMIRYHETYLETMEYNISIISKYKENKHFPTILSGVLEQYEQDGDIEHYTKLVEILDYSEYHDESIREQLAQVYEANEGVIFSSPESILNNVDTITHLLRMEYYFDNQVIIDKLKENITGAVFTEDGKGGFYDTLHDKYSNSSSTGDPLGLGSGVGTYSHSELYNFYGDFIQSVESKYWYGTDANDSSNMRRERWYFREEIFYEDNDLDKDYGNTFQIISNGTSYYIWSETAKGYDDYLILTFNGDELTALTGYVTIYAYHNDNFSRQYIMCECQ